MGRSRYGVTPRLPAAALHRRVEKWGNAYHSEFRAIETPVLVVAERPKHYIIRAPDGGVADLGPGHVLEGKRTHAVGKTAIFFTYNRSS